MILKGSQRGGSTQLAAHLMNTVDNDHVTLEEVRGFVSTDLRGALEEAHAVSLGTKCRQFMFSLSVNPPRDADATLEDMVVAVDRAEEALGLSGQPRALVVHEKNGRRHLHVVWSRIDAAEMKAINLPHFKNRLAALSKELYLDHGWQLPDGHKENGWKNPLNFTLAEWQQAKRLELDPREVKQILQIAWERSDSRAGFANALEEHGYYLARGDRRGFVVVDMAGHVLSLSRFSGIRTKDLEQRLGDPATLPSVGTTQERLQGLLRGRLAEQLSEVRAQAQAERRPLETERQQMVAQHRVERVALARGLEARRRRETADRAARFRSGVRGVFDILTGRAAVIRRENDREAFAAFQRDRLHRERIYQGQMKERQALQLRIDALKARQAEERRILTRQLAEVLRLKDASVGKRPPPRTRRRHVTPSLER